MALGVLGAQFKDLPDFDAPGSLQHVLDTARTGVAGLGFPQVGEAA
jgi:hypothetical protein